jgi:hypothetical protein
MKKEDALFVFGLVIIISAILLYPETDRPSYYSLEDLTGMAMADGSRVARSFNATSVSQNQVVRVTLTITISGTTGHTYYAYEEHVPAGWVVVDTSGNPCVSTTSTCEGGWVTGGTPSHSILKVVFVNGTQQAASTTFTYHARAPSTTGIYTWTGVYWIEGMTAEATIENQATVSVTAACTPSQEICDGIDNDCDGLVDQADANLQTVLCEKQQGVCQTSQKECRGTLGWYPSPYCQSDPTWYGANFEAIETRCDGLDNDCDGSVDEPANLIAPSCNRTLGVCANKNKTCAAGAWQECTIAAYNSSGTYELVETRCDNLDNDCDGQIDEGCACTTGSTRPCGTDIGECTAGTQTCTSGQWGVCIGGVNATAELCDGRDNDCDGTIDNGILPQQCALSLGVCAGRTQSCVGGTWQACTNTTSTYGPDYQQTESLCDGLDNDCDGLVDESLTQACTLTLGVCANRNTTCSNGAWLACNYGASYQQTESLCDGLDNDCDGQVDEGCACTSGQTRPCGTDTGACVAGTQSCVNGQWSTACQGAVNGTAEVCDGIDNDCDNQTDEGIPTSWCEKQQGVCAGSTQQCANGQWQVCDYGADYQVTETSCTDGRDNDCDGLVDSADSDCSACISGMTRNCGTSTGACEYGTQTCTNGAWGSCVGGVTAVSERCNDNIDNDCDGSVDEGCSSSGSGGGGGGGGGSTPPTTRNTTCVSDWVCSQWSRCNERGQMTRTCTDAKSCRTPTPKPAEIETCSYTPRCDDGIRNGLEEGVDCGGNCAPCRTEQTTEQVNIEIIADDISAEILDSIQYKVRIKNHGDALLSLELTVDKHSADKVRIDALPAGDSYDATFDLLMPSDIGISELLVQVTRDGQLISSRKINIVLLVPKYSVKLVESEKGLNAVILVDNRNDMSRDVIARYEIIKDGDTYYADEETLRELAEGEVFHKMSTLPMKNLPDGEYEVKAAFYSSGEKVGESTSTIMIGSEGKAVSSMVFYIMLGGLVIGILGFYYWILKR